MMQKESHLAGLFCLLPLSLLGCAVETSEIDPVDLVEQELGCSPQLVPVMTSATSPKGTVFSSGNYAGYPEWQAFDSSKTSMWISSVGKTPAILGYDAGTAMKVSRYAITYANGGILSRAPKNWTLEGWNGSSWVVLDKRTNQINWAGFERREYTLASTANYSKYQIKITDDNDSRTGVEVISMGAFELGGCDSSGTPIWTRNFGSSSAWTQGMDMVGDPGARTYLVGATTGSIDGQTKMGLMDGYLRATDWDGKQLFTHQFGVPGGVTLAYGIARNFTFEEFYIAGFTDGPLLGEAFPGARSAFVMNTRYTGVRHWTRLLGTPDGQTEAYSSAVDRNNNMFAVGGTWGNLDGNVRQSSIDGFVAKYNKDGVKQWTRTIGTTSGRSWSKAVAADLDGNVYVLGYTEGSFPGYTNTLGRAGFLAKFTPAGILSFVKLISHGSCFLEPRSAVVSYQNRLFISGNSSCGGGYVGEYDLTGNPLWERTMGGFASKVYTDAWGYMQNDNLYISGSGLGDLENPAAGTTLQHGFIASFTPSGVKNWMQQLAPPTKGDMILYGVTVDEYNRPYAAGNVTGPYNGSSLIGTDDAILVKMPSP